MQKPASNRPPLSPAAPNPTFGRLRKRPDVQREPRREATLRASLKAKNTIFSVQITNTSRSGIALRVIDRSPVLLGEDVTIATSDFGLLYGTVRWQRANQVGVEFNKSTKTKNKIAAYFSFFRKRKTL